MIILNFLLQKETDFNVSYKLVSDTYNHTNTIYPSKDNF